MWRSTLFYLCAVICTVRTEPDVRESRLVRIAQGRVRGYKDPDTGIYFFQGIPYASMPTGHNRFKASLPAPTWMHILEAVSKKIVCPQTPVPVTEFQDYRQQEDCLIASVYVPDVTYTNLPVVVYVHAGAFQVGSGDMLIPSKIVADNNIIAVTFNYRLGSHGFLCLGTEDIPGNAGMKDQVAALRWVKNNIASFGGNPEDVTIHGSSAGSAAVDLLMLSKSAEGLFNKVIPESGASIAQWTIQSNPLENAKQLASYLNFAIVNDTTALEYFFKTISFELLTSVSFFNATDLTVLPSPCVERHTGGEEVFLDKSPVEILKKGNYRKVPLLYGFTNMEGLSRVDSSSEATPIFNLWKTKMNEKFSDVLPADLKFESNGQKEEVAKEVKKFYFGNAPVSQNNILDYIDFFTDVIIAYPMLRSVKYHVEAGHKQIYLYEYSFVDDNTPYVPHNKVKGANHCAQTEAVFGKPLINFLNLNNVTTEFLRISSLIRKIWGTFIKTGKPIPEGSSLPPWPPVGKNWSPHMSLGNEITLKGSFLERRMRFWDDIYSKHYRDPIPPPTPSWSSHTQPNSQHDYLSM